MCAIFLNSIPHPKTQKCRIRIRESRIDERRHQTFGDRLTADSDRVLLGSVVREELYDLNVDLAVQDRIAAEQATDLREFEEFVEAVVEQELEYLQQLEDRNVADPALTTDAYGDNLIASAIEAVPFFCPICQTNVLQPVFDHVTCERCALRFKSAKPAESPMQLQYDLLRKLVEHEQRPPNGCAASVVFFAEPVPGSKYSQLNVFCDECDFYASFLPSE